MHHCCKIFHMYHDWISTNIYYNDIIMGAMMFQINSLTIVHLTVYLSADQRKDQSPALLAFVRGNHRRLVNSPLKGPITRKMFPFDDVIFLSRVFCGISLTELIYNDTITVFMQAFVYRSWKNFFRQSEYISITNVPPDTYTHNVGAISWLYNCQVLGVINSHINSG